MAFSSAQLKQIYDRASGYCHIYHKKVAFKNYGVLGAHFAPIQADTGEMRKCAK
jgi:hypothetical protein